MSIGNVSGMGVNPYAYTNSSRRAAGTGNFAEEVQKAAEGKDAAEKSGSSAWAGDMVVPQPPSYFGFTYDSGISNKSKLILSISFGRNIIEPNGGWGILLWKIINN